MIKYRNTLLIIVFLLIGISRTLLYKNSNLNIDSYQLTEKTKNILTRCPKILVIGRQFRPYLFTSNGIGVFTGFKRLNSISRQIFFEKLIVQDKLLPYHHHYLYEKHYPLRLSSNILDLAGICHVVIPDDTNLDLLIDQNKFKMDYSKKKLDIFVNSNKKILRNFNILEFKKNGSSIILRVNKESKLISEKSHEDIASSIFKNLKEVSNGNLLYTKSNDNFSKRIFLKDNYKYAKYPNGFKVYKISKKNSNENINIENLREFILFKQETFAGSSAYCQATNEKLIIKKVNLIQSLIEAPALCEEIIIKI